MRDSRHVEGSPSRTTRVAGGESGSWDDRILVLACIGGVFFCLGRFAIAVQEKEQILRADAVVAKRYELVGSDGKTAATFRTMGGGEVSLSFYSADGAAKMEVGVSSNGEPSVRLYDASSRPKLTLHVSAKDESPRITLSGAGLVKKTLILSNSAKDSSISIVDTSIASTNRGSVLMGLDDRGAPFLSLRGGKGTGTTDLTVKDRGPRVSMRQRDFGGGTRALDLALDDQGESTIRLWGKVNQPEIFLSVDERLSNIRLSGEGNQSQVTLSVGTHGPGVKIGKAGLGGPYTEWRHLPDGTPAIFIADDKGIPRFMVTLGKDGTPSVRPLQRAGVQ